jgi:protein TonB
MEFLNSLHHNNEFKIILILKFKIMKSKKSKKANLERMRGIFFQIGMVISLTFVLLAFNWTTERSYDDDWMTLGEKIIDDDIAEVTIQKKKKQEIVKPKIIKPIEVIPDDVEIEDDPYEIDAEVTDETENNLDNIPEMEEEPEDGEKVIFTPIQNPPEFPGGERELLKFLSKNLKYPSMARDAGITGIVYVSFIVWKNGSVTDIAIKRGIGGGCDEEVIRVLKLMPKWKPGEQNGKKVNVAYRMPVVFKLK